MYALQDLIPSTRVDFFVSAVSNCCTVGGLGNVTEFTDDILVKINQYHVRNVDIV